MSEDPDTRSAKAAASEAIGKLIGDDDAVQEGRRERPAKKPAEDNTSQEQE